jgi:hypothetical protein
MSNDSLRDARRGRCREPLRSELEGLRELTGAGLVANSSAARSRSENTGLISHEESAASFAEGMPTFTPTACRMSIQYALP